MGFNLWVYRYNAGAMRFFLLAILLFVSSAHAMKKTCKLDFAALLAVTDADDVEPHELLLAYEMIVEAARDEQAIRPADLEKLLASPFRLEEGEHPGRLTYGDALKVMGEAFARLPGQAAEDARKGVAEILNRLLWGARGADERNKKVKEEQGTPSYYRKLGEIVPVKQRSPIDPDDKRIESPLLALSADGRMLLIDGEIWDTKAHKPVFTFTGQAAAYPAWEAQFTERGVLRLAGGEDDVTLLEHREIPSGKEAHPTQAIESGDCFKTACARRDGSEIYYVTRNRDTRDTKFGIVDKNGKATLRDINLPSSHHLVLNPDESLIATPGSLTVHVWEPSRPDRPTDYKSSGGVERIAFGPDGTLLGVQQDTSVMRWTSPERPERLVRALSFKSYMDDVPEPQRLAFDPSGLYLAASNGQRPAPDEERRLRIFDLSAPGVSMDQTYPPGAILGRLALSANRRVLAVTVMTGDPDKPWRVDLWDVTAATP
jgi:hypothetical protein